MSAKITFYEGKNHTGRKIILFQGQNKSTVEFEIHSVLWEDFPNDDTVVMCYDKENYAMPENSNRFKIPFPGDNAPKSSTLPDLAEVPRTHGGGPRNFAGQIKSIRWETWPQ